MIVIKDIIGPVSEMLHMECKSILNSPDFAHCGYIGEYPSSGDTLKYRGEKGHDICCFPSNRLFLTFLLKQREHRGRERKQTLMVKSLWKFMFTPLFSFSLKVFSELKVRNKHPHLLFT